MIQRLQPDFYFADGRGFLCQLVHDGYKQVNVVYSQKGAFRGGHHHEQNDETFYIVQGELEVIVSRQGVTQRELFKTGDMFMIPKGVSHDFRYMQDSTLVVLYDNGVELPDGHKDIIKD